MLKLFFLFSLSFATALFAISDAALLKRANTSLASQNKSELFRSYNDFKNLYLRAIMEENDSLKINALKGIVQSGKKLHIDISTYEDELKSSNNIPYKKPKTTYKKPKPKPNKISKKAKKIKIQSTNKLKKISWEGDRLVITFSKTLRKHQVNYFKLYNAKKNEYKYIFDIEASMLTSAQTLTKANIESIKLAQFKPNIIRLVIKDDDVVKVRFARKNNKLSVLIVPSNKKPPAIKKPKKYKTKRESPSAYRGIKTIVIDPGHGGKDPGAVGYRHYREKVVVLAIGRYLRDYLKQRGYKVYMTRSDDRFIKLRNRTKYANRKKADLFISIHANAARKKKSKAQGIETYFLSPTRSGRAKKVAAMENQADLEDMNFYGKMTFLSTLNHRLMIQANKLALDIQQSTLLELRKHYKGVKDGGVREGPFWVLVGAAMPSVLIEVGFITHPKEAKRLANKNYEKHFAKGIADGIERYFLKNR